MGVVAVKVTKVQQRREAKVALIVGAAWDLARRDGVQH